MNICKLTLVVTLLGVGTSPLRGDAGSVTAKSDSWALTDALGRKVRMADSADSRHDDRFVGMFYWTWHQGYDEYGGNDDPTIEVKNITEVLASHPDAISDYNHPAWGPKGHRPGVYYWDEPLFGYYKTTDPWVLRRHAEMLADAGIDCIIMDCTNGSILWEHSLWALMATWTKAQADGVNVPKIAFMLPFMASEDSRRSLRRLYDTLYSKGLYDNLWFYWKGKPLIMAYPDNLDTTGTDAEIREFFTFRPGQPDYVCGPAPDSSQWGWLEVWPTHGFCPDPQTGRYEQCTVGVAQNASAASGGHCSAFNLPDTYGRSRSGVRGFDPRPDAWLHGWNFQEQWDRAIDSIVPELVFITGWNEWTSGMWTKAHGWSDPLSFVDQFDRDHSRDLEPTRGWGDKGDVYYAQLVDNVRRFKGMAPSEPVSAPKTITLGRSGEWDDVTPRYQAYRGNTIHRDHPGRYNKYYSDTSGRNDIIGAQVARDDDDIFFRVQTAQQLTPPGEPGWMMLLIDADRDKSTGWCGYDYAVNRVAPGEKGVILERCVGNSWSWQPVAEVPGWASGRTLELAVPRAKIGMQENVDFEFKWCDNLQHPGDPLDFYVSGDVAPGGRFNYVYSPAQH